jgi:hypothetical protein
MEMAASTQMIINITLKIFFGLDPSIIQIVNYPDIKMKIPYKVSSLDKKFIILSPAQAGS